MTRSWPIIAVEDVASSSAWYRTLLDADENHPGARVFNQLLDADGTVLLCLHHWGPSGPHGDHEWPGLSTRADGPAGNGLLLWFLVDDLDAAWTRALELGATIHEPPNDDNGTGRQAFVVRDPDGYYVTLNDSGSASGGR